MTGPRFHASRAIAAAPDRVWALLVDLPSWSAWNPAIVSVVDRVIDGASGTFGVRLEVRNPNSLIPAGAKCRMRFVK